MEPSYVIGASVMLPPSKLGDHKKAYSDGEPGYSKQVGDDPRCHLRVTVILRPALGVNALGYLITQGDVPSCATDKDGNQ